MGRYPVHVVMLTKEARFDGDEKIDLALQKYASMDRDVDSDWQTVQMMDRPSWATKSEDIY